MSRPKGSKNLDREFVDVEPSRCGKCDSTEREGYSNPSTQDYPGMHNGKPYTRIVRRHTKCKSCGQARVDRVYEYIPEQVVAER